MKYCIYKGKRHGYEGRRRQEIATVIITAPNKLNNCNEVLHMVPRGCESIHPNDIRLGMICIWFGKVTLSRGEKED
jgi:hypothetical protein